MQNQELEYNSELDLFSDYENLPLEVQSIIDKYNSIELDKGLDYIDLQAMQSELNVLGYDFEYYLDAQPFNLHKLD
jgi:hypothetical protein